MAKRRILLEVEESRAEEMIQALSKRSFVRVIQLPLDRTSRKSWEHCPVCAKKMSKESRATISGETIVAMVNALDAMIRLKVKSVIFVEPSGKAKDKIPRLEQPRTIDLSDTQRERAEALGIIVPFMDGAQKTYFISKKGLEFLRGKALLSPSTLIIADGHELAREGRMDITEVKFQDEVLRDIILHRARKEVATLPSFIKEFVESGQMSLLCE